MGCQDAGVMFRSVLATLVVLALSMRPAYAEPTREISLAQALAEADRVAPDIAVSVARERVAGAEVDVANIYPNPTWTIGTSTQAARLSAGLTIPLVVLGQRGASERAARAELATSRMDTRVVRVEVRTACAHAFVVLWLAQRTAEARGRAVQLAKAVEEAAVVRVGAGVAAEVERLRAHAERLRVEADAQQATLLVDVAASELARWVAAGESRPLRARGDPAVPDRVPPLRTLAARLANSPVVLREDRDAAAALARAERESALVRPNVDLELGIDAYDSTLPAPNYRAQLGVEIPIFNQRGPEIRRERMAAAVSRAQAQAAIVRLRTNLVASLRAFEALTGRQAALSKGVVPAAESAAQATRESYELGRAPLVMLLDAEQARIEANLALIETRAERAHAWIDVLAATGGP